MFYIIDFVGFVFWESFKIILIIGWNLDPKMTVTIGHVWFAAGWPLSWAKEMKEGYEKNLEELIWSGKKMEKDPDSWQAQVPGAKQKILGGGFKYFLF